MELAADKRLLAEAFASASVPTPVTWLAHSLPEAERIRREHPTLPW